MSNNKESSVEWLISQFKQFDFAHSNLEYYDLKIPTHIFKNITEQAKAMHKEEMIQSYSNGWHDGQDIIINGITHIQVGGDAAGQQYYNSTYGGEQ